MGASPAEEATGAELGRVITPVVLTQDCSGMSRVALHRWATIPQVGERSVLMVDAGEYGCWVCWQRPSAICRVGFSAPLVLNNEITREHGVHYDTSDGQPLTARLYDGTLVSPAGLPVGAIEWQTPNASNPSITDHLIGGARGLWIPAGRSAIAYGSTDNVALDMNVKITETYY
jgi:hypothetical protein